MTLPPRAKGDYELDSFEMARVIRTDAWETTVKERCHKRSDNGLGMSADLLHNMDSGTFTHPAYS